MFKKMKEKKVVKVLLDKLFANLRMKNYRKGISRINRKKHIKQWFDSKVKHNGKAVMIQYLPSNIVDSPYLSKNERKRLEFDRNREGFVTSVSQTLAKLLVLNNQAKLVN